jgi:hypothetical protein
MTLMQKCEKLLESRSRLKKQKLKRQKNVFSVNYIENNSRIFFLENMFIFNKENLFS